MNSLSTASLRNASMQVVTVAAAAVLLASALAGCSAIAAALPAPSPTPTETPVAPYGDGVLTIGSLLPRDGDQTVADLAGIEAAVRDAHAATTAGVTGVPVLRTQHRPIGVAGDGSIAQAVTDLASRGVDVLIVRGDDEALAEIRTAAAAARMAVFPLDAPGALLAGFTPGAAVAATLDEVARVRAEDPAVLDGALGVAAYRMATLAALGAVAAKDDGGASIEAALPHLLSGPSMCSALDPCVDTLANSSGITYVPVAGTP